MVARGITVARGIAAERGIAAATGNYSRKRALQPCSPAQQGVQGLTDRVDVSQNSILRPKEHVSAKR